MKPGWHICTVCNHIYEEGLEKAGIKPCDAIAFDALPDSWKCPECSASMEMYQSCSCVGPTGEGPAEPDAIADVFRYLDADHHRIDNQLRELTKNYSNWSIQEVFDHSVRIFDEIRRHFDRQESLLCTAVHDKAAARSLVDQCMQDRKRILDEMDNLMMSHVDDPDFRESLSALLARIEQHIKLSHETLYSKLPEFLSPEEVRDLNAKYEDVILGYR